MATRGQYGRGEGKGERRDEGRSAPIYTWRRVLRAVTVNWSLVFEGHRRSVLGVLVGVRKQGEWRKKCLGTRPLSQAPVSHPPLARLSRGAPLFRPPLLRCTIQYRPFGTQSPALTRLPPYLALQLAIQQCGQALFSHKPSYWFESTANMSRGLKNSMAHHM